ncbi:glycosyl hydrolase [Methylobacterium sp. HMF5984]|uniref:glycosyl hydrolase n=1 Tax=Methylobacterium sp. HMF5984 TaxID=3367370 RepID=UPI0038553796
MTQTGVFVGTDPADFASYSKWVGSTPGNVLTYLNNDSWKAFDSSIGWATSLWKNTAASNIWSVPLTVWGTSLEQVATGDFNDHFLKAAQALAQTKASSDGNIYVRVGWEFNGSWMPWAANGHEAAFIKSFQNLVDTFRSVSDKFKFVWDTTNDGGNMNPEKAYPGDKYVDVIGTDVYYSTQWDGTDAAKGFKGEVTRAYGLQWQQDFAAAHGKATAISEWGVASDNAAPYVQAMTKWMADHNMVYENYWDSNADYSGKLSTGANATAGAAYKSAIASLTAITNTTLPLLSSPVTAVTDTSKTFTFNLTEAQFKLNNGHDMMTTPSGSIIDITDLHTLSFADGTVTEHAGSTLIDDLYYDVANPDVWKAHVDPTSHYNTNGWHEGRDPNPFFSTVGYLAANSDVAKAGINPLTHYDSNGWKEYRDPSANFDTDLYLARNPDVKAAGIDPLAHYLQYGQAEGRQAYTAVGKAADLAVHPGFDAEYYLLSNPDVAKSAIAAGGDSFAYAYQHYETYGWHEGRNPNAVFDTKGYLAAYSDVKAANIDPLAHYDSFGWKEGRDPSASFDTKVYQSHYADVANAHIDPMLYYLQYGAIEGQTAFNDGHFG